MTSSLVSASDSMPESRTASRTAGMSSQPHRRGRPVTEPNSLPRLRSSSPIVLVQLGRERPVADARGVPLGDAQHGVDLGGADPEAGAGAAGGRRRRGHERIRAVVEVEQNALRPLEEDVVAAHDGVVHGARSVAHEGPNLLGQRHVLGGDLRGDSARRAAQLRGRTARCAVDVRVQPRAEALRPQQIADAQADAGRLALVGRADPLLGGPDARPGLSSRRRSISMWCGKVRWARSATTRSCSLVMKPCPRKVRISSTSTAGSITIPSPSTQVTPSRRMPDGIRRVTYFFPSTTRVCPALAPPAQRTTQPRLLGQEVDDLPLALVAPLNARRRLRLP